MLEKILNQKILILDGAMGTMIQRYALKEEDYRGKKFCSHPVDLKGNNELLSLTRPEVIKDIHRAYLAAGADIIETNTFNANAVSQADYRLEKMVYELNLVSARLARSAADEFIKNDPSWPRFVAGSVGPTNRTASLSADAHDPGSRSVTFDRLVSVYQEQVQGLIDGGVDIVLVETVFDTLNCKAALFAVQSCFEKTGNSLPLMISGTVVDKSGRNLSGQTPEAFYISVQHSRPLSVGLNCSMGARDLRPFMEEISQIASCYVSCYPNAGLPNEFGEYNQSPEEMAGVLKEFAKEGLVNIVGGCCGSTPDHVQAIAQALAGIKPRELVAKPVRPMFSGMEPLIVRPETTFINVGERTNVAGSKRFAQLIVNGDYDAALAVARQQVEAGAQVIDINMDEGMLDSEQAMVKFLNLLAAEPDIARVPIMLDSSRWSVLEAGLKCVQGKAIVNSLSLKEGEGVFIERARKVLKYGAALVVMAFDEQGQAETAGRKVEILSRAYRILVEQVSFPAADIIFDPNVFAVATGLKEHDDYARAFIDAVQRLKELYPVNLISGGVSNVSFSFRGNNAIREAMHSVFLYHAIKAGMGMGIVNAGMITVYDDIPQPLLKLVEDVILNRHPAATDQLIAFAKTMPSREQKETPDAEWRKKGVEERLAHAFVQGIVDFVDEDAREALGKYQHPLQVIEGPLMAGMNQVGDLFAEGKMFLPQVIKSARVMKRAVEVLKPYLSQEEGGRVREAGKILMATVKGDVHDIGKNIVGIVLSCNHFKIIDLGVMVPCEEILRRAQEEQVDMICLSGLITPSLEEMVHVAKEMERQHFRIPLLIGGAATSPRHCAVKIAPCYQGPVVYVKDASRSVQICRQLMNQRSRDTFLLEVQREYDRLRAGQGFSPGERKFVSLQEARAHSPRFVWGRETIIKPSFLGTRILEDFDLRVLSEKIDWTFFFVSWGLKKKYPGILKDPQMGQEATKLFDDAQRMLEEIIKKKMLAARGVVGFYPAHSRGDDLEVYGVEKTDEVLAVFHFLRQQSVRADNCYTAMSDFVAPREGGSRDYIGAFAVTSGIGLERLVRLYEKQNDSYKAMMLKFLADRLAEAFAEHLHEWVRKELWGYAPKENLSLEELLQCRYQGIRPAIGYPAWPDHSEKFILFQLLDAQEKAGIRLTENAAMLPSASVCGLYIAHPLAKYFEVGPVLADQQEEYARRKGWGIEETRKWLGPLLMNNP